jgi:type IV pilus assembly protein PilB
MADSKKDTKEFPAEMKKEKPEEISEDKGQPQALVGFLLEAGLLNSDQIDYATRIHAKLSRSLPIIDVLKELKYVDDEQIQAIIHENLDKLRLGDLLVELGMLTEDALKTALQIQSKERPRKKLGEILVSKNLIKEQKLLKILSIQLKIPICEPDLIEIDKDLFSKGSVKIYEQHRFIPVQRTEKSILVAFADPLDLRDLDVAKSIFGEKIERAIASIGAIHRTILKILPGVQIVSTGPLSQSAVEIVDEVLGEAILAGDVSDIHIEPMADRLRVRFRRDGVLLHFRDYNRTVIPAITSRIKILCKADIAEKRRHQGGRILYSHKGRQMDLRVSFYVTIHGEKIVLRILNRQNELLSIGDIGMAPRILERFKETALDCPSGVIIITGPTGSGKTTTVYSCINHLNTPECSIVTAEEPVEYVIEGISQCSINPKINLTFEETLRHIVRQDPDVIVIGEIRDSYSADVAVQAALTGHKVLTTFHTEDSIGGLIRLLNMDIDAFLISSTVVCVVAQRLLRTICPSCKAAFHPSAREILRLGNTAKDLSDAEFARGKGCSECFHTGYKGRSAVFELLFLDEQVRDGLVEHKTSHQIREISIRSTGLVTMFEDGIVKAARGITTIEEVLRVLPRLQKPRSYNEIRHLLGE